MIRLFLAIQAACIYPANPAGETRNTLGTLATVCREEIARNPQNLDAYNTLGFALLFSPREALLVSQAGLGVAPNNYYFQLNAGLILRQLNRFPDALIALKRAATLDSSGAAHALAQAGLVAQQMKRHTEAMELFEEALRRGERTDCVWGHIARSLHAQQRYAEAVQAWDRADNTCPNGFIDEGGDRRIYERSRSLSSRHGR